MANKSDRRAATSPRGTSSPPRSPSATRAPSASGSGSPIGSGAPSVSGSGSPIESGAPSVSVEPPRDSPTSPPDARFELSADPIDPSSLTRDLTASAAGACVTFEGRVRDSNDGRRVLSLDYEAYEAVALKEGTRIVTESLASHDVIAARCIHRVGHLEIGDVAVWVGVISGHRGEAFVSCRYIIDEVKARVPIWKKEHYAEGDANWIENRT